MRLLIVALFCYMQVTSQSMFNISLSIKPSDSVSIEVLQIITDTVNGNEEFVTFLEDAKAQNLQIDSIHYFISLPLNGIYMVKATCLKTLKRKDLYVRTSNQPLENTFNLDADFTNENGMNIWYDYELKNYMFSILYEE